MSFRTYWYAPDLRIKDEPLAKSLWEYRLDKDRRLTSLIPSRQGGSYGFANLISSRTPDGTHLPIIDLDFPHHYEPSSTEGHSHLYIDVPMSKFKWFVLMCALRYVGVVELGYFVWSLRRGGNFMRLPGFAKSDEEHVKPTYGWFRKLKT